MKSKGEIFPPKYFTIFNDSMSIANTLFYIYNGRMFVANTNTIIYIYIYIYIYIFNARKPSQVLIVPIVFLRSL